MRPYRKWFKLQSGVYFYKTVTGAKKNCPVVFDWRVPPNAVSTLHNLRGVVYSRKGGTQLGCTLRQTSYQLLCGVLCAVS